MRKEKEEKIPPLDMVFPCTDKTPQCKRRRCKAPDRNKNHLHLVATQQILQSPKGTPRIPYKLCLSCRTSYPAFAFIYKGEKRTLGGVETFVLEDGKECANCCPRRPIPLFRDNRGRLRMRVSMRNENDQPYRWLDESTHRWRSFEAASLRLMTGKNEIRFQPYTDRKAKKEK